MFKIVGKDRNGNVIDLSDHYAHSSDDSPVSEDSSFSIFVRDVDEGSWGFSATLDRGEVVIRDPQGRLTEVPAF